TSVVAVTLVSGGVWRLLASRRARVSPESIVVVLSVIGAVVVVAGTAYARAYGIPRLEGRQLGGVSYTASFRVDVCRISVDARTTEGRPISIPEPSTLTFHCGKGRPDLTIYAQHLAGGVRLPAPCPSARLAQAWPTVAGLPPGIYELVKAVRVLNA